MFAVGRCTTVQTLSIGSPESEYLRRAAYDIGAALDGVALHRFRAFAALLDTWNTSSNLISCRSGQELVERHFVDCLRLVPLIPAASTTLDLGSGAGFPGIPVAIARPDRRVLLVESRRRRANFLREVRRKLRLENVSVIEGRAEDAGIQRKWAPVEVATSRAVWRSEACSKIVAPWLVDEGLFLWMRGLSRGSRSQSWRGAPLSLVHERSLEYEGAGKTIRVIEIFRKSSRIALSP